MKPSNLATMATATLCMGGLVAVIWSSVNAASHRERAEAQLANPLGQTESWQVLCPQVDGGTTQDLLTDTGGTVHTVDALVIQNTSTTCLNIGGAGLTPTNGQNVGAGTCAWGKVAAADVKGGKCVSDGDALTVQAWGGRR